MAAGGSELRTREELRRTQGHVGGTEGAGSLEPYVEGACGELEHPHASGWEEDDPPHQQGTWNPLNLACNL